MQMASGLCLAAPIEDDRLQGKIVEHFGAWSGRAALGGSGHREVVQRTAATNLKLSARREQRPTAPGRFQFRTVRPKASARIVLTILLIDIVRGLSAASAHAQYGGAPSGFSLKSFFAVPRPAGHACCRGPDRELFFRTA